MPGQNLSAAILLTGLHALPPVCYSASLTDKFSTHICRPDEKLKLTFMTNAVGPIIAYKYFKSLLDKGETKMIVNFASNYGSIALASEPLKDSSKATPLDHTQIAYKASKAAVNMGMFADVYSYNCSPHDFVLRLNITVRLWRRLLTLLTYVLHSTSMNKESRILSAPDYLLSHACVYPA